MKNKTHLHQSKQLANLKALIALLIQRFAPLSICQFGLQQNSQKHKSVFTTTAKTANKQYYLLMLITGNTKIENGVQDCVNANYPNHKVTVLVHSQATVLQAIAQGHIFFTAVCNKGKLLYGQNQKLAQQDVSQTHSLTNSLSIKTFYAHKMPMAFGFVNGAGACLELGNYVVCSCLLYQAVEHACLALLKVLMGYSPQAHQINRLLDLIACVTEKPRQVFTGTPTGQSLFKLLCTVYHQARYGDGLTVTEQEATALQQMVYGFVRLAKELCESHLAQMETIVLQEIREVQNA